MGQMLRLCVGIHELCRNFLQTNSLLINTVNKSKLLNKLLRFFFFLLQNFHHSLTSGGIKTQDPDSDCLCLNLGSAVSCLGNLILLGLNFFIYQMGATLVPARTELLLGWPLSWEITLSQDKHSRSFQGANGTHWAG